MKLTYEQIAEVCHENNRAYCHALGDYSQPAWKFLTPEQQETVVNGVLFHIANPDASPKASHENWMRGKFGGGWKVGPVKDSEKKEHPNLVPYSQLSKEEKVKDIIFSALVNVLGGL